MKAGLTTSLAFHAVVLGFGILSLSTPRELAIADVESFPVDIVPIEEIAQSVQGDREAPVAEKPAPVPTTREEVVPEAAKVGDNTTDLETPPTPDPSPRPVEAAEAPPPSPTPGPPAPEPEPVAEPVPEPEPEPETVPATEVTPEPQPRQEVAPEPATETAVAETPSPDAVDLPTSAPTPQSRPQPPQAQTAKAPERQEQERPAREERSASSNQSETETLEDEVAALLNRDKASGGGAQRSSDQAALGGRRTTGAQLSQSERDALIAQIQACWNVPVGADEGDALRATVRFRLDPTGTLEGRPVVEKPSGNRQFDESTVRAIQICSRRGFNLPSGKHDAWSEVLVNFDPREMF